MLLIFLLWVCWCGLHSLLVAPSLVAAISSKMPWFRKYYRVTYNAIALTTLVPLVIMTRSGEAEVIFSWSGAAVGLRLLLLFSAFYLFYSGAKKYDLGYFLGIKQVQSGEAPLLLGKDQTFSEDGVFGVTRHPWYLGALSLLWSGLPVYHEKTFLAITVLSIYLWIGTILEESRIRSQFGVRYDRYSHRVSRLIPWKWLAKSLGFSKDRV